LNEYSVLLRSLTNIRESLYSRLNDELAEKVILLSNPFGSVPCVGTSVCTDVSEKKEKKKRKGWWRKRRKERKNCRRKKRKDEEAQEGGRGIRGRGRMKRKEKVCSEFVAESLAAVHSDVMAEVCADITHLMQMAITSERLHKQSMVIRQICRLFPLRRVVNLDGANDGSNGPYDQICNARLPRGLDPHSGSCSLIWQRDSYWDARPSSQSYSCASPHSLETHVDLQKGISLVKKSVACITTCCYNSLCLDVPSEASTFEAFAKLLTALSSSRELQSTRNSLKMACSRPAKQAQQLNRSVWDETSGNLSSSLTTVSMRLTHVCCALIDQPNARDYHHFLNYDASFVYSAEVTASVKSESLVEGWDIVERPPLPSPQSQVEDVEHWTLAIYTDATKR
ncbi:hypothetical protein B296_00002591, partial [Ensete ventricosum]